MKPGKVKVCFTHHPRTNGVETLSVTEWETYDFTDIAQGDNYVAVFNGDKLVALFSNDTFERLVVEEQPGL